MAGNDYGMTSRLSNSVSLHVVQDSAVELSEQPSLGDSRPVKYSVGNGLVADRLKLEANAGTDIDVGEWVLVPSFSEQTTEKTAEKTTQASSRNHSNVKTPDDDEEFFDAIDDDVDDKLFNVIDDEAGELGEKALTSSKAQERAVIQGDGVRGEDGQIQLGNGEESAKIREEVQSQQGWLSWALQAGLSGLSVIDSFFQPGLQGAETSAVPDTASEPQGKGAPKLSTTQKSAAEQSQARIKVLTAELELSFAKLSQQLVENYKMPALALAPKAGQLDVPLSAWDNLGRMGHNLFGWGSAGVSTLGQVAVAAAIPTVANALPVGIGARISAMASGLWLGLSAIAEMPDKANIKAALSHVDSVMAGAQPLLNELNGLIEGERQRAAGGEKTMMVSLERNQRINELVQEKELLINALARVEVESVDMQEFLERPVALGTGESRAQILNERQRGKSAFQSFFASIGQALSQLAGFLSKLPDIFWGEASRREAERSENAYLNAYRDAFRTLSTRAETSGVDILADPITRMMQQGYSDAEMERLHKEVGIQLYRGENLYRLISDHDQVAFGRLTVASHDAPDIKYSVPASVSMARDLASYFSLLADKGADDQEAAAVRHQDGTLTVADPEGQLYSFLMSIPSAYTNEMANGMGGAKGRGARASLTIDDHRAGFPGGARSMQFERVLQLDSSGNPVLDEQGAYVGALRVVFLADQPQPIYAPLANEGRTLRSVVVRQHLAERRGLGQATSETEIAGQYARMESEELAARLQKVNQELEQNRALLQVEQEQFSALQNWRAQPSR